MRRHAKVAIVISALLAALILGVSLAVATAPTVSVEDAYEVSYATAKVKGTVDPKDRETSYRFQYATAADFSDAVTGPEGSFEAETGSHVVEPELTGLAPKTTYHLRLLASNEDGEAEAVATNTFETLEVQVPKVSTNDAAEVKYTTAKASGTVDPQGADEAFNASCRFDYITQAKFDENVGNSLDGFEGAGQTPCDVEPVTGSGDTEVKADLTGLNPATEYRLRLVASNLGGTTAVEAASTFTTLAVTPPTATIDPVSSITASSAHFSGQEVNPSAPGPAPQDPAFDAKWSFTCVPACGGPKGGTVAADNGTHAVADDAQLEPNTEYTVTLHAKNLGGESTDQESFTTDPVPPEVEPWSTWATNTKALVSGRINAHNSPTAYHFEYGDQGPCSANPCAATPSENLSDNQLHIVNQIVTGLTPRTTYYFRLIAEGDGTVIGPDRSVITEPRDRAYEMVSIPDKNGGNVSSSPVQTRPSNDGNAVMYTSKAAFADTKGLFLTSHYIAQRGPNGWATHSITPLQHSPTKEILPTVQSQSTWLDDFSADLSTGIFLNPIPLSDENPNVKDVSNLYLGQNLLEPGGTTFELLSDAVAPVVPPGSSGEIFTRFYYPSGASTDLGHVIFTSPFKLTANAPGNCDPPDDFAEEECARKLYEWDHGTLRLAGMVPDPPAAQCGGNGPSCVPAAKSFAGIQVTRAPGFSGTSGVYTPNAISQDGSRIFFTTPPHGEQQQGGRIYVREDAETTRQLNVSERMVPDPDYAGGQAAKLWTATPDGRKAFFTTAESLVDADTNTAAPGSGGSNVDLYMAELDAPAGERLTLLTGDRGASTGGVDDVLGVSDDGSYVYFLDARVLVPGALPVGQGNERIYLWHDGTLRAIGASFGANETAVVSGAFMCCSVANSDLSSGINLGRDVRVTPSGSITFATAAPQLDGYDKSGVSSECNGEIGELGQPCTEVYVYNPVAAELQCASCSPTDERPLRNDTFTASAAWFPGASMNQYESAAISPDGSKTYFSSRDPLVPQDTNGRYDAYEYDVGRGQLHLVSSGQCNCDSLFVNSARNGADVYFTTNQRLVGIDTDKGRDLYDFRAGGGIAAQNPPQPALCEGDACQAPAQAPNDPTPGSSTFSGVGTPRGAATKPRKCGRGKRRVRSKGSSRCVGAKCGRGKRRVRSKGSSRCVGAKHSHRKHTTGS